MIIKILSSSAKFNGVVYNTNKVERNKGDLMKVANFGALQGLGRLRPQDYINYLQMVAAQNSRIKKPQFHAVLSAKGKTYSSKELTEIAEGWLDKMGYGRQPYLIVFHRDTENNHVHIVSVRVNKDGQKINSAYEKLRAIGNLKEVLGIEKALSYSFGTRAQFFMIMENLGLPGKNVEENRIAEKLEKYQRPITRIAELRELFSQNKCRPDLQNYLFADHHIALLFHAAAGKSPYGYSIIDHKNKLILKGSEVMSLKELLENKNDPAVTMSIVLTEDEQYIAPSTIRPIWIADDVDDQQIHGMRRRRQKKARTNTR